jgi:hypothetical protein
VKEPVAVANVDTPFELLIPERTPPGFGVFESAADTFNKPID